MKHHETNFSRLTLIGFDLEALRDAFTLATKLCLPKYNYDSELLNYQFDEILFNELFSKYQTDFLKWNRQRIDDPRNLDLLNDTITNILKGKDKILQKKKRKKSITIPELQGKKISFKIRKSLIDDVYWVIWYHMLHYYMKEKKETDLRKMIDRFPLKTCTALIKSCFCQEPKQAIRVSIVETNYFHNLLESQKNEFLSFYEKDILNQFYRLKKSLQELKKSSDIHKVQLLIFRAKHKL